MEVEVLEKALKYLKMSKLSKLNGRGREVEIEIKGKKTKGFASAMLLLNQSAQGIFSSSPDVAILYHWLSYFSRELFHCSNTQELNQCSKYINQELLNRPYLCGFAESIADLILFIVLSPFISEWSYHTKESFINISRWYSTIQAFICKMSDVPRKPVTFSRTLLYSELSQLKISA